MSRPLRILLSLIEPPVPFGDAAARWYYVLFKGLVDRGHRVTAFASCSRPGDAEEAHRLFPSPDYDLRTYPVGSGGGLVSKFETLRQPYSYQFRGGMRLALDSELASGFDVLHLEHTWSGWLGLRHVARSVLHVHYLARIDLAEARILSPIRLRMTLGAESRLLRTYRNITTLTPRLSAEVSAMNPSARVDTVPLGLDASLYPFDQGPSSPRRPTVGLIGSFNWQPSRAAADRLIARLWPAIVVQVPEARLLIVGRKARLALAGYAGVAGLEVVEDVPDTVPYFREIDVLLYAPERGSGMKVKILESFALGTSVVTNGEGVEGLPAVDGVHAGIADDDEGLIARTVALLKDADARLSRRVAARALVETHCGPGPTVDAMAAIHARVAASGSSRRPLR